MFAENYIGTVVGEDDQGLYVEVFRDGQTVKYGPMHYVSSSGETVDYNSGDAVFITSIFFRDQFIVIGKYIDIHPEPRQLVQVDSDGDGIIDVIEESYTEEQQ